MLLSSIVLPVGAAPASVGAQTGGEADRGLRAGRRDISALHRRMRLWRRNDRWRARFYNAVTAHPFGQGRQRCCASMSECALAAPVSATNRSASCGRQLPLS
ncbi:hypothetical protein BVIET440_40283 [Burkholderia vietnamiensis]